MKKELIDILKKYAYKHGRFTLSSGEESEHYVNCKPVILTERFRVSINYDVRLY